jgi:hypothetical protein
MITVGATSYIEVLSSVYHDGWPGAVATSDEVPGLCGLGQTLDDAADDLADQFCEITWH